ncbi:MAG: hypothetical protein AB7T22_08830 [Calditrichaceae bacterium]
MRNYILILILLILTLDTNYGGDIDKSGPNRFLIGFEKRIDTTARKALLDRYQGKIIKEVNGFSFPVYLVEINRGSRADINPADILDQLECESGIMYVSIQENNSGEKEVPEGFPSNPQRQGDFRITKPQSSKYASNFKPQTANSYEEVISHHLPELRHVAVQSGPHEKSDKYNTVFEISLDKKGIVTYVRIVKSNISDAGLRKKLREFIYSWNDFPERTAPETLKVTFKFEI